MHFLRDPFTDSASVRNNRKRSKQRKLDLYWDGYLDNVPRGWPTFTFVCKGGD